MVYIFLEKCPPGKGGKVAHRHPILDIIREERELEAERKELGTHHARSIVAPGETPARNLRVLSAYAILVADSPPLRVCMVRELKKGQPAPRWGFPGGGRQYDEKPHEAAMRETSEECSLRVTIEEGDLLVGFVVRDSESRTREERVLKSFYRTVVSGRLRPHPGKEQLEAGWLDAADVLELEKLGQINPDHARAFHYLMVSAP